MISFYEYMTQVGNDLPSVDQLNEFGSEGWELVQIVPWLEGLNNICKGQIAVYFRRPNQKAGDLS